MKRILSSIFFLAISLTLTAQSKNLKAEQAAIRNVIENESKHFWARDYQSWKKLWVHSDYAIWIAASRDGVRQYDGWKAWSANVKEFFAENPEPMPYTGVVTKENYRFRVYGQGAWVSFVQNNKGTRTLETRILEKRNGQWKIAMVEIIHNVNEEGTIEGPDGDR